MLVVDIPVDACQQRRILGINIIAGIAFLDTCQRLISVNDGLCQFGRHKVAVHTCIIRSRILSNLAFYTTKEEQFIFNNWATNSKSIGFSSLIGQLIFFVCQLIPTTIQVFVRIIIESCSRKLVRTTFSNDINGTTGKAALTNIERRSYHLYLLDGIHRDRITAGTCTILSCRIQTEHVVTHHTVNLERVVFITHTCDRYTTILAGNQR